MAPSGNFNVTIHEWQQGGGNADTEGHSGLHSVAWVHGSSWEQLREVLSSLGYHTVRRLLFLWRKKPWVIEACWLTASKIMSNVLIYSIVYCVLYSQQWVHWQWKQFAICFDWKEPYKNLIAMKSIKFDSNELYWHEKTYVYIDKARIKNDTKKQKQ